MDEIIKEYSNADITVSLATEEMHSFRQLLAWFA
jgi:hypothetical protein